MVEQEGLTLTLSKKTIGAWIGAAVLGLGGGGGTLGSLWLDLTDRAESSEEVVLPSMVRSIDACTAELRVTRESLETCRAAGMALIARCVGGPAGPG